MQKLETINTTQTLTESTEERVVITESVSNPVSIAETTFKSSIARSLAEEFGYELDEADPNDPNGTSALAGQQKAMQDARAKKDGSTDYTSGLNPAKSGTGLKAPAGAAATMGQGGQAASPAAAPAETPAAAPTAAPAAAPAKEPGVLDKVGNFFKQNAADYDARQKADAAANSPEGLAAAKAKLTPSQLKWLGGAEPNPIILSRMPAPLPGEVAGGAPAAGDKGAGAELSAAAGGDAAKNPNGSNTATAIPGGAAAGGAAAPAVSTADPKQVARLKELLAKAKGPVTPQNDPAMKDWMGENVYFSTDPLLERLRAIEEMPLIEALTADEYKELQKIAASLQVDNPQDKELQTLTKQALDLPAQFAADTPAAAPADGQAASPTAPAAAKKPAAAPAVSPAIVGYASSMGLYKNGKPDPEAIKKFQTDNGLKADGVIGPNTSGAILSAQKPGAAGSGRGGQGGPTAAQAGGAQNQLGKAPAAGAPAANPKTADIDAQLEKYKKYPQSNAQIIARLEKEKTALSGGAAASPTAAPTAAPAPQPGGARAGGPSYIPASPAGKLVAQDIARAKAKAAQVAPDGNGSGTLQGGQVKENIITQDDAILAMIRTIRI